MTWKIFTGDSPPHDGISRLPDPPPWRRPGQWRATRGTTWRPLPRDVELVNAALYLRRPLLVTGPPGSGKSSVAYAVATELRLGRVLEWPVNSRSAVEHGKYLYDAVARLRDISILKESGAAERPRIDAYLRLGPLGTALATSRVGSPRVLLVDELDKSDFDFPNDLLYVLEHGEFEIPEIQREIASGDIDLRTADGGTATVRGGRVEAAEMPFVIITSNGERDLPPAFLRRCLRLDFRLPRRDQIERILQAHIEVPEGASATVGSLVERYLELTSTDRTVAVDQLMNAVLLVAGGTVPDLADQTDLRDALLRDLGPMG